MGVLFVIIGAVVILFGVMIWNFISFHNNLKSGKGLSEDVSPVIERYATLLEKNVVMERTGSYKLPSHHISYVATFRIDDGEEIDMNIPQEMFEILLVGSRDVLVTQNKNFIDFGERSSFIDNDDHKNL